MNKTIQHLLTLKNALENAKIEIEELQLKNAISIDKQLQLVIDLIEEYKK